MSKPGRPKRNWLLVLSLGLGVATAAGACQQGSNPATLDNGGGQVGADATAACNVGVQGCACATHGQTVACGHIVHDFGSYVSCESGISTCENGTWGACNATTVYQKSKSPVTVGSGAGQIKRLSNAMTCTDPCDPNTCTQTTGTGNDVPQDAGVVVNESGVSLPGYVVLDGGGGDGGPCMGLQCQVDWGCPSTSRTTLTGTVYDPVMQNPLYNAFVYIPVDPNPAHLPAFSTGASCDSCSGASLNAVAVAQTDTAGNFTLLNVPTTALAPNNQIPVVVQMGKWRRVQMLSVVPDCTTTQLSHDQTRLPRSHTDGYNGVADIPRMGFASGSADPLQCMMLKMGIDPGEFQIAGSGGSARIDYYVANGADFYPGGAPNYSNLVNGASKLDPYDVVLLPCEGTQDQGNNNYADSVAAYTLLGGRMFTTHYGYTWLATPSPGNGTGNSTNPNTGNTNIFYPVAKWNFDSQYNTATGQIDTNFPKGQAFETWMDNLPTPNVGVVTSGQFTISSPRHDVDSVNTSLATEWIKHAFSPNETFSFTFDTPLGVGLGDAGAGDAGDAGAQACGRVVYSDFHVTTAALKGVHQVPCTTDNDCGYGATCSIQGTSGQCAGKSCYKPADCGDTAWSCSGNLGTCGCYENSDCSADGAGTCSVNDNGKCSTATCVQNSDCTSGNGVCSGVVDGKCGCFENNDCSALGAGACSVNDNGKCSTATCKVAGDCATGSCSGAVTSKCGCMETSECATMGAGTCSVNDNGLCSTATCSQNSECTTGTCSGGTMGHCTLAPLVQCDATHACGLLQGSCTGAVVGKCKCAYGSECASGTCSGATAGTCSVATCDSPADCSVGPKTCAGGTLGKCTCGYNAECASGSCVGETSGTCSTATCINNGSCTSGTHVCSGITKGKCGCGASGECSAMGAGSCSGRTAGTCSIATCSGSSACPAGTRTCGGATSGSCSANTCSGNAQCAATGGGGQEQCDTAGNCNGCFTSTDCPAGQACNGAVPPGTCTGDGTMSPMACSKAPLDAQESALEFMLLDLTACVQPDNQQPMGPPMQVINYNPATFTLDFQSSCPMGTHVRWLELDWQANIPSTASIAFSGQTAAAAPDGGIPDYTSIQLIPLAVATTTTANLPVGWDAVLLDTHCQGGSCPDAGSQQGKFNLASPPVLSQTDLRLTITLTPTTDKLQAPTLIQWQVKSDCPPAE